MAEKAPAKVFVMSWPFGCCCTQFHHLFINYRAHSGNKRDLEQLREVNVSEAKAYAQHHGMMDALETSAKENTNVDEAFLRMAKVKIRIITIKFNLCVWDI